MTSSTGGLLVAVASCPNPPLLLVGRTGGPVAEVAELRSACLAAIAVIIDAAPEVVVIVGADAEYDLAEPLSIAVGSELLSQAGWSGPVQRVTVPRTASPADAALAGVRIRQRPGRVALLVMADGSACRTLKAPGYLDERAVDFDDDLTRALLASDWATVAGLRRQPAEDLLVAGRAAWQVLAGVAETGELVATSHYAAAPFGVWYPVISYLPDTVR
jgi:hypothetical protein